MIWIALLLAQASVAEVQDLIRRGELTRARTLLDAELSRDPADPALLNLLGVIEGSAGNCARAEDAFRKALAARPDNPAILLNLARVYQRSGQDPEAPVKAIQTYRKVLRIEPANGEARYQLAFLLARQGSCDAAMQELNRLSASQQETPQAVAITSACLASLARLAYEKKDYEAALGFLAQARTLKPSDAGIHFFFGMTAVAMNLVVEAKSSLSEAVRLAPENPYHHYALGAVLAEQRDASAAIPHFEKYRQLRPDDPRGRFGIAVAYFQSNQFAEAEQEFRTLTTKPKTQAGAYYFLGRIAKAQNRLDDAERELLLSLKLAPANLDAEAELGQVYQRLRKDEQAEARLNRVLQADPQHYLGNLTLLALYQRRKDPRANEQKEKLEKLQAFRQEREQALWRTVEFRPY